MPGKRRSGVPHTIGALILEFEDHRERQLSLLLDRVKRLQDTTKALNALRLIEENLAELRSKQGYHRAREGKP